MLRFVCTFAGDMRRKRILVVDDEQDLCEILLYNLKAAGYQVEERIQAKLHGKKSSIVSRQIVIALIC